MGEQSEAAVAAAGMGPEPGLEAEVKVWEAWVQEGEEEGEEEGGLNVKEEEMMG
jgi:hypothetical protein